LLFEDFEVYGDEYSILDHARVIPYPRRFHIKEGTLNTVPEIAGLCKNLKPYILGYKKTYFIDPLMAGFSWKISPMDVNTIYYLKPNRGKESKIKPIPKMQILDNIIHQIDNFSLKPGPQIKNLTRFVQNTNCYVLYSGDLNQAARLIKETLS